MNTSLKWIEALVPGLNVDAQEYTDAMILSGSKVEFYKKMDADLEKIVVGQIKKIEPHPDADKLIICQVDVGTGEDIQIVTGAPNVKEGDKVSKGQVIGIMGRSGLASGVHLHYSIWDGYPYYGGHSINPLNFY